jgi:hypothetical protein
MEAIVVKRQRRRLVETHKRDLAFKVRGEAVLPGKIDRWMERNNIAADMLYPKPLEASEERPVPVIVPYNANS